MLRDLCINKIIADFFIILVFSGVFIAIWMWDGTGAEFYRDDIDKFNYYFSMVLSQFIGFLWAYDRHPENRFGHLMAIAIVTSIAPIIVSVILFYDARTFLYAMCTIYMPLYFAYAMRESAAECH